MNIGRLNKILVCYWICCLDLALSSVVELKATPDEFKDGLTSTLNIRCSVNDTAASAGIVGRRDITQVDDDVTQTADNVAELTSFILMKDGKDIVSVSHTNPAHVIGGSANMQASGSLTGSSGERGFLQLSVHNPASPQTGEYTCEANAVTTSGHTVTFKTSTEVTSSSPTTADLVAYIRQLKEETNRCCNKPEVFFSAAVTQHLTIASGVVVFDDLYSNVGGAYDHTTGLFTCTVPGYYRFDLNALATPYHGFYLYLQHNTKNVFAVFAREGTGNQGGSSNNAIVHLAKNDVIRVVTHGPSMTFGTSGDKFVTMSGQLISAD